MGLCHTYSKKQFKKILKKILKSHLLYVYLFMKINNLEKYGIIDSLQYGNIITCVDNLYQFGYIEDEMYYRLKSLIKSNLHEDRVLVGEIIKLL